MDLENWSRIGVLVVARIFSLKWTLQMTLLFSGWIAKKNYIFIDDHEILVFSMSFFVEGCND
jgi:hypothetical protein